MSTPTVERKSAGALSSMPSRINPPVGGPSAKLKRSPFTPATVAFVESRRSIEVTRSRPTMALFDRIGFSS